jgi:LmbE family N-acetylglucosaminyl deacetylase
MRRFARSCVYVVGIGIAAFLSTCLYLHHQTEKRTRCDVMAGNEDILIFAPHPDDGVIIAGGFALQTKRNGGKVTVVFLTGGSTRLEEAYQAWSLIGLTREDLIRLHVDDLEGRLTLDNEEDKIEAIEEIITEVNPEIIFIPLYEGGHIEHDITNYLVSRTVKRLRRNVRLYECPEYNFYFSVNNTPEKILDCLSKFVPFFEYYAPPSFINSEGAYYLCMTNREAETKKRMLRQFKSQLPETLVKHFGFNDRFKPYTEHDYHARPHDYGNSLVYAMRYSHMSAMRRIFSRPMWKKWTVYTMDDRRPLQPLLMRRLGGGHPHPLDSQGLDTLSIRVLRNRVDYR